MEARVETGTVTRRPIPNTINPARLNKPITTQNPKIFQNCPLVMAQLSFIEATGPSLVSMTTMGEKENLTAQKIPGIMRRIKPPMIVKKVKMEVPKYLQKILYSSNISTNFGLSPSWILRNILV